VLAETIAAPAPGYTQPRLPAQQRLDEGTEQASDEDSTDDEDADNFDVRKSMEQRFVQRTQMLKGRSRKFVSVAAKMAAAAKPKIQVPAACLTAARPLHPKP
jgi:hypothetical protein